MDTLEPKGKFHLEQFGDKYIVAMQPSMLHTIYYCPVVKPRNEALTWFWRYIGAA